MEGFAMLKVAEGKSGEFVVVEDVFLGTTVCTCNNPRLTREQNRDIANRIAAALDDENFISEADLDELEQLAKRVQDRSEYGGGLVLRLVNMYRNVKMQPKPDSTT